MEDDLRQRVLIDNEIVSRRAGPATPAAPAPDVVSANLPGGELDTKPVTGFDGNGAAERDEQLPVCRNRSSGAAREANAVAEVGLEPDGKTIDTGGAIELPACGSR